MHADSTLELPVWLASEMSSRRYVTVLSPHAFRPRMRAALDADPNAVRLRMKSPVYYSLGLSLAQLLPNMTDAETIPQLLLKVFATRCLRIFDTALNSYGEDVSKFESALDNHERKLFQAGLRQAAQWIKWKRGERTGYQAAKIVTVNQGPDFHLLMGDQVGKRRRVG